MAGSRAPSEWRGYLGMLEPDDRAALLGLGRSVRYRRGARIIIQGDHSDDVFLVVEGRVKVTLDTAMGHEVVLAVDGRGDLVGAFEAIDSGNDTRTASTVALEPVVCRVVTGEQFRGYLAAHPAAALALVAWVIRRLQTADRRRVDGTTLDTPHRLAQFLLDLIERDGWGDQRGVAIDIPVPQRELASLIGVSRNSVVRALATLRSRGLVTTSRHTITIADPAALRRYAE